VNGVRVVVTLMLRPARGDDRPRPLFRRHVNGGQE
jgi:hypothetical protein